MSGPQCRVNGGSDSDAAESARPRPWWIVRLSREKERRLYFLATVASAAWYLAARFL